MCANPLNVRALVLGAKRAGMVDSGQLIFFNLDLFDMTNMESYKPWIDENATNVENEEARDGFKSVLTVTAGSDSKSSSNYSTFAATVRKMALKYFNYSYTEPVSTYSAHFYDAALLYCHGM